MRGFSSILVALALCVSSLVRDAGAVSASQVLVLYNADWDEDQPLTENSQDSLEVAEHYVRMHTDPATGEKPYLLGLRCAHGKKHLDGAHLKEGSSDNTSGVVGKNWFGRLDRITEKRDSRTVEFTLPNADVPWRFSTLSVEIRPDKGRNVTVVKGGKSPFPKRVLLQEKGDWNVRLDARPFAAGTVTVAVSCENEKGSRETWTAEYHDAADFSCSRTGADGVRDDLNYVEDVEAPVKAFLENSANARPDGTLLRDHVLFIVVCYGLPKTAVTTYGIAHGITEQLSNFGTVIDLGQRLQLLHYDLETVAGFSPVPQRFTGTGLREVSPFTAYYMRAPLSKPFTGRKMNPFLHPMAYEKEKGDLKKLAEPVAFTTAVRKSYFTRHLYFSTRIDGQTPLVAKGLVDRAVYASRHGGPSMGVLPGMDLSKSKERTGYFDYNKGALLMWELGYRHFRYEYTSSNRLELFRLAPGKPFFNDAPVFLPGGIATVVESHQGWNRDISAFLGYLTKGVTVTVAAAQVYEGAPHIHNQSFWDDAIFYSFLARGKSVGECLLMNQVHLEWISAFIGDPLYRLAAKPHVDRQAPRIEWQRDIQAVKGRNAAGETGVWVMADLRATADRPEVAQMRLVSSKGRKEVRRVCPSFDAKPVVFVPDGESAADAEWTVEVIDPFGNRSATSGTLIPRDDTRGKTGSRLLDFIKKIEIKGGI